MKGESILPLMDSTVAHFRFSVRHMSRASHKSMFPSQFGPSPVCDGSTNAHILFIHTLRRMMKHQRTGCNCVATGQDSTDTAKLAQTGRAGDDISTHILRSRDKDTLFHLSMSGEGLVENIDCSFSNKLHPRQYLSTRISMSSLFCITSAFFFR